MQLLNMSVKSKLHERSNCYSLVLNDNELNLLKNSNYILRKILTIDPLMYCAVIMHDKDYDEDIKQFKTIHYHVVMQLNGYCRVATLLNKLTSMFCINYNQISIEKCNSVCMQTRYLIHLDDFDKYQYSKYDIQTNNQKLCYKYIDEIKRVDSIDDLIRLCKTHHNLFDLMSAIGMDNYKKYRLIINDIRREQFNL